MYRRASASAWICDASEIMRSLLLGSDVESFIKSATSMKPRREGSTGFGALSPNRIAKLSKYDFNSATNYDMGVQMTPDMAGSGQLSFNQVSGVISIISNQSGQIYYSHIHSGEPIDRLNLT